jgi:predicted amidophosphoribosyltransferase
MRPKTTIEEQMDRRLEAEAMFQDIQERPACPQCAARVQPDFILCPMCRAQLRTPCAECGEALRVDWVMCPFCTADRRPAPAPMPRRAVSGMRTPSAPARPAFATGRPRG